MYSVSSSRELGDCMLQDFKHQTKVVDRFKDNPIGAILLEMGLGKSRIIIKIAEHKYAKGEITAVLIVMPKSLLSNWAKIEIPKHSEIPYSIYMWKKNTPQFFRLGKLQYFLINHDGICTEGFNEVFKTFMSIHKKFMLVAEESTGFKSMKAKRTKRIISIARVSAARFIMTGAPIVQSPLDIFSQYEILGQSLLGHKNMASFRSYYALEKQMILGPRRFNKIVGYHHLPELTKKIQKYGEIMKKEDVLDLPEMMFRTFPVDLTAEQAIAYEDLRDTALAFIKEHEITAVNAISLVNKLLQLCSGQIKAPDGSYLDLETDRISVTKDLVEECSGLTVIWCAFVRSAQQIAKAFDKAVHVRAEDSAETRFEKLEMFRRGDMNPLIMNPASGGVGITITECRNVIYYDRSWNYEHRIQSLARTHRIGQTGTVSVTDMFASKTIEEKVIAILKEKEKMANLVITSKVIMDLLTPNEVPESIT